MIFSLLPKIQIQCKGRKILFDSLYTSSTHFRCFVCMKYSVMCYSRQMKLCTTMQPDMSFSIYSKTSIRWTPLGLSKSVHYERCSSRAWLFLQSLFKIIFHCCLLATICVDPESSDLRVNSIFSERFNVHFVIISRLQIEKWSIASMFRVGRCLSWGGPFTAKISQERGQTSFQIADVHQGRFHCIYRWRK
jgi:hypothetical protein